MIAAGQNRSRLWPSFTPGKSSVITSSSSKKVNGLGGSTSNLTHVHLSEEEAIVQASEPHWSNPNSILHIHHPLLLHPPPPHHRTPLANFDHPIRALSRPPTLSRSLSLSPLAAPSSYSTWSSEPVHPQPPPPQLLMLNSNTATNTSGAAELNWATGGDGSRQTTFLHHHNSNSQHTQQAQTYFCLVPDTGPTNTFI